MFTVTYKNTDFYNEFYVHIVVWVVLVWEYDEMNCDFVFGVSNNIFWSTNFGYMK
jgi:hypothetical protein